MEAGVSGVFGKLGQSLWPQPEGSGHSNCTLLEFIMTLIWTKEWNFDRVNEILTVFWGNVSDWLKRFWIESPVMKNVLT